MCGDHRYYLSEEPILRNVETHICGTAEGLAYTLAHLADLVVKPVGESGGYGIVIVRNRAQPNLNNAGDRSRPIREISSASPMVDLSVCPTLVRRQKWNPAMSICVPMRSPVANLGITRRTDFTRRPAGGDQSSSILRKAAARRHMGARGGDNVSLLARYAENLFWLARYVERAVKSCRDHRNPYGL